MESGSKLDPDPKHWIVQTAISTISPVLPHIMWAGAVAYMWAIFRAVPTLVGDYCTTNFYA
jgi:hypothetical protein